MDTRFYSFTYDVLLWPGEPFARKEFNQPATMLWSRKREPSMRCLREFLAENAKASNVKRRVLAVRRGEFV